ncbi:MAG: SAM-dependent methyltransferase [Chloroflexota bacterium]|nr:SAM-dependent methyltransferase [Chloroflexota bacterium]
MTPLEALLRERIAREGPLSFREVMAAALYHPRYGYYSNLRGFGADGDFVTSPELDPIFGQILARAANHLWEYLGRPRPFRVLEYGAGSGALAAAMLEALPYAEYAIEEPSPSLRRLQRARLGELAPPTGSPHLVIANEVLDALPVHRVTVRDGRLRELRVDRDLQWVEFDPPPTLEAYFARLKLLPPEGAVTEACLDLEPWVAGLARRLERGLALILDYGYTAEALYARQQGSLLTYYRHTLGSDPLVRLGEQDISVHVDFTSLATCAHRSGLQVIGVISQGTLLRNLGIGTRRPELVDPRGLGRVGVLFLGRGLGSYVPLGLEKAGYATHD